MSRILPIKKSLDDRFINETDVITEQALAQVIEGQGGTGGGGIEVVRFSDMYDEATDSFVLIADKTYDELLQAFQDGKVIFGLTPDYEATTQPARASALSCNYDSVVEKFIFTGFVGDGSDITHNWPQLEFVTYVLNLDNSINFETHYLSSEIELKAGSKIYTGSPYIPEGVRGTHTHLLSLGGTKPALWRGTGASAYGVIWVVNRVSGTNIEFSIEDVLIGESQKALAVDTSSASDGEVAQAVITAQFVRNPGGVPFVASMLVTVCYASPA